MGADIASAPPALTGAAEPLYQLCLPLDVQRLEALGRRLGHPGGSRDGGYLGHCLLSALFGEQAPRPFDFRIHPRSGWTEIVAYGGWRLDDLERLARRWADAAAYAVVDWSAAASKPMPDAWEAGEQVGLRVRACPIQRHGGGGAFRPGAEVDVWDAYLAEERLGGRPAAVGGPGREDLYLAWFAREVAAHGAVELLDARVLTHGSTRVLRRDRDRQAAMQDKPEALFAATARIHDGAAFTALLRRGIGRHRAFGFGYLSLTAPAAP